MNPLFKKALIFLLMLALPMFGGAMIVVPKCPVQEKMVFSPQKTQVHGNCCKDKSQKSSSSRVLSCKAGHGCQAGTAAYFAASTLIPLTPTPSVFIESTHDSFASPPQNAVWRPPLHS